MARILKGKVAQKFGILVPELTSEKGETFKEIIIKPSVKKEEQKEYKKETEIQNLQNLKEAKSEKEERLDLNELKEKARSEGYKEGFEKGYKEGQEKGYQEGFERGREEGLKRGYEEGLLKAKEEVEKEISVHRTKLEEEFKQKIETFTEFLRNLEEEVKNCVLSFDREVLFLAKKVCEKILEKEIGQNSEYLIPLINKALSYIAEGAKVKLKVNPEDFKFLKEHLGNLSQDYKIELISDETIKKGGFFIETEFGVVDGTLEKRWEKVWKEIEDEANLEQG